MATRRGDRGAPVHFQQLDQLSQRRLAYLVALRIVGVAALVFAIYFLIPVGGFNDPNPSAAWIRLAGIAAVFVAAMVVQMRRVAGARVPQARAVEAVVHGVLLFVCLFALFYLSMSATDAASFSEPLTRVDALYFTVTTFATVGFGDIAAVSQLARAVVTVQMIAGLGLLVLLAKLSFYAARRSLGGAA
jgi:voltage-gated potassium channel